MMRAIVGAQLTRAMLPALNCQRAFVQRWKDWMPLFNDGERKEKVRS